MDAIVDKLYLAYDWAKEWQILLAGLLVVFAALILASATLKAARLGSSPRSRAGAKDRPQPDLRWTAKPGVPHAPVSSNELVGTLEQLRSLIRSALASLTLTSDKENSPAYFLCQRILHLRFDQLPLASTATRSAHESHAALLKQLGFLRLHLTKDSPPGEISEILVQINTSARNLVSALVPGSAAKRRKASSDLR